MDEWHGQRNENLVREIDRLVVEAHPELEYALDGKSSNPEAPPVSHGKSVVWSQGGSFVNVAFCGEDGDQVRVSAHHPARPLQMGERLEDRMAAEQRDGRRLDNKWTPRNAQAIAEVVVAFLVSGSVHIQ
jgi:hypothetical protein